MLSVCLFLLGCVFVVCKNGMQQKASKLKKGFASKTFNAAILDWYIYIGLNMV
jgi:hypothetical protein